MKITKEWLLEKKACSSGVKWFENQKETELVNVVQSLNNDNHWEWASWLLVKIMSYKQYISYAAYSTAAYSAAAYTAYYGADAADSPVVDTASHTDAYVAAKKHIMLKILNHGIKIIEEEL